MRARAAALRRHHPDQPDVAADLQRSLKADALERAIVKLAPPLTAAQRARLAVRLLDLPGDAA
jgi:hypothetical protein